MRDFAVCSIGHWSCSAADSLFPTFFCLNDVSTLNCPLTWGPNLITPCSSTLSNSSKSAFPLEFYNSLLMERSPLLMSMKKTGIGTFTTYNVLYQWYDTREYTWGYAHRSYTRTYARNHHFGGSCIPCGLNPRPQSLDELSGVVHCRSISCFFGCSRHRLHFYVGYIHKNF